ncbi:MAG TPA: hypothetical protein VHR45_21890 [Thermoanaerobaculia bacterium]|nr:hypothetical protein [Thermoanaerobaculia bacterium]
MTKRTVAFILSVLGGSVGAQRLGCAQMPVTTGTALLEVRTITRTVSFCPTCGETYKSDTLLVYTNGFTVHSLVINTQGQPFAAFVLQGQSPAAFATLAQALQSNQAGLQSGDCSVDPITVASSLQAAGMPAPAAKQIIWYGRHGRMNSIAIGDSFTVECTDGVKNISLAIGAYEAAFLLPPAS